MQGTYLKRNRPNEWRDALEKHPKRNRVEPEKNDRRHSPSTPEIILDKTAITGSFKDKLDTRETDPARLAARKKQIDLGKCTPGYQRYIKEVPLRKREYKNPMHPRTPDRTKSCSKRSWDGQIKIWRRALHRWDPPQDAGDVVMGIGELDELGSLLEAEAVHKQSYENSVNLRRTKEETKEMEGSDSAEEYDASRFNGDDEFTSMWEDFEGENIGESGL